MLNKIGCKWTYYNIFVSFSVLLQPHIRLNWGINRKWGSQTVSWLSDTQLRVKWSRSSSHYSLFLCIRLYDHEHTDRTNLLPDLSPCASASINFISQMKGRTFTLTFRPSSTSVSVFITLFFTIQSFMKIDTCMFSFDQEHIKRSRKWSVWYPLTSTSEAH